MPKPVPKSARSKNLKGTVESFNHSPKGTTESLLLTLEDGTRVQVNVGPALASDLHEHVKTGDAVTVNASTHSDKRPSSHPVYTLDRLKTASGQTIANKPKPSPERPVEIKGKIAHLNYAKHGEPNGAMLDTGDFVHLRPHGARAVDLKVGQRLTAKGTARPLEFANGRVLEASHANGKRIEEKKKPGHKR